ncbi:MAG: ATP-binding cassette domain-containing protein [Rhodocyclaceae bacterium]|nr:ATP-binding cassette domain-containing protein [Rhodocyclaceae bacterium]
MIQFRKLRLARGAKILVDDVDLQIHPGWKVGVAGANGCGKSSLFGLLRGELHQEQGDLEIPPAWEIAHVAQETPALERAAIDYALDGDRELRRIEQDLAAAEAAHEGERIGLLHGCLQEIGGYAARARAAALLDGLGFAEAELERPVAAFSGGWRMRLNLAQALMCRSDLLLLDEPTNHLDLDAVFWLEQWLRDYPGTLLLISHDRDFLDAVVGHVAHIEQQRLSLYPGGYSAFERVRGERLAQQQVVFEKQQRERAHLHRFVERFRAKATKARQAQSRIKALERMELVSAAHVDTPFTFAFRPPEAAPDPLLQLEDVATGYGEVPVLAGIGLSLRPGERIGLLGRNGAGKSTLIKLLAGELGLLAGQRLAGKGLALGYFAQHQLESLRPEESPLQHMQRQDPVTREQELRDYLGGFDFRGDAATTPCGPFSGGEKSRLALALLIWQRPNLLLLDEPTNHLDLEMRHALTLALQAFEGAMLVVSHDRALLRATCDRFLLVNGGKVEAFDGDLDDYRDWLARQRAEASAQARCPEREADRQSRQQDRARAAADRQARLAARRPLNKELGEIEKRLEAWQREKADLDARVADPAFYQQGDGDEVQRLLKRQAELGERIEAAETRWLELHEALEALAD